MSNKNTSHFTPAFKSSWDAVLSLAKERGGIDADVKRFFRDEMIKLGHEERVRNLYRVKSKMTSKAVFFVPNGPQEEFLRTRKGRDIILKCRQIGMTTLSGIRALDYVLWQANTTTGILAHLKNITVTIFEDLIKVVYEHFKKDWGHLYSPVEKSDSTTALAFTDDGLGRLLNSSVRVFFDSRGKTLNFLHVSEASRVEDDRLLGSLQGVPANGEVIYESTPQGRAGDFYRQWRNWESMGSLAPYKGHFVPWFKHYPEEPENWILPADAKLTQFEQDLKDSGLTDAHIAWRRWCIEANCQGDVERFENEYPSNTYDCFFSGEALVFPSSVLKSQDRGASDPRRVGFLLSEGSGKPQFHEDRKGVVAIWEEPDVTASYAIGADPSGGVGKDRGAAWVKNQKTGKFVARLWGQFDPADFANELIKLGTYYNKAFICVESNNHGHVVLHVLTTKGYRNLYRRKVIDEITNRPSSKVGFVTTNESKIIVTERLKTALKNGTASIPDRDTITEMSTFVQVSSKTGRGVRREANPGSHDDLVMAASFAEEMHTARPVETLANEPLTSGSSSCDPDTGLPWN